MKIRIEEHENKTVVAVELKKDRVFEFTKPEEDGFTKVAEEDKISIEDLIECIYNAGKENFMLMVSKEKK